MTPGLRWQVDDVQLIKPLGNEDGEVRGYSVQVRLDNRVFLASERARMAQPDTTPLQDCPAPETASTP